MENKFIELEEKIYERVSTLISLECIENKLNYNGFDIEQDSYEYLGKVVFDDDVVCVLALVSGMSAYWIDAKLHYKDNTYSEPHQYYSLEKVIQIEEKGTKYNIVISKKGEQHSVVSYCWSNNPSDSFDETWEENCQEGDLLFNVPKGWLLNEIIAKPDDYSMYYNFKDKIKELNFNKLLEDWSNCYTHEEGYKLFCEGIEQKVVSNIKIKNCKYCFNKNTKIYISLI